MSLRTLLDRTLQWLLIGLMVTLTVIVIVAVFYRKFGASLSWYDEVASIMLAWITYYGAALAALHRQHLGFDSVLIAMPSVCLLTQFQLKLPTPFSTAGVFSLSSATASVAAFPRPVRPMVAEPPELLPSTASCTATRLVTPRIVSR